jgi:hypothetical protein
MHRIAFCGLIVAAIGPVASAQKSAAIPPSEKNFFIGTPAGWSQPKTPWGDPDIQGIWPLAYVGSTPLQRCNGGGGGGRGGRGGAAPPPCDPHKEFLTQQEWDAVQSRQPRGPDRFQTAAQEGEAGRAFLAGVTDPTVPQRQTSLLFDPPDGKLPEMTPEGKRLMAEMKSSWALPGEKLVFDSYKDFDLWDRCITRGMPVSMFPFRYNNGVQIIQSPGQVTILMEMIHEARIVPLNDNTPVPASYRSYMGVARGHWEGNTLVVVSTNFKAGSSMTNTAVIASPPGNRWPTSEQMKITEKFTRINNDYLIYEITDEDPVVMTHSWTARFPLKSDPNYKLLEYTCHEDNRVVGDWISVSRAERAGQKVEAPRR